MKSSKILFLFEGDYSYVRSLTDRLESLSNSNYPVRLICLSNILKPDFEIIENIPVHRLFKPDIFDVKKIFLHKVYAKMLITEFNFDIVHAYNPNMLRIAVEIKKIRPKIVIVYDSLELFHSWPLNVSNYKSKILWFKSYLVRKYLIFLENKNSKKVDYLITVNDSLSKILKDYFRLKNPVTVLRNVPKKYNINIKSNKLREIFGISENQKILVFIGGNIYAKTLNLEQVIDEFANIDGIALVFICADNIKRIPIVEYVSLKKAKNIYFHDLIQPEDIPNFLSSADVGLVPTWNKKDLSYWYALDNKLFEYIQSKIPVLATKQPEYVGIVEKYNCGVCVNPDEKNAYINGFKTIIENNDTFRNNAEYASDELCWEIEELKLIKLYQNIVNE